MNLTILALKEFTVFDFTISSGREFHGLTNRFVKKMMAKVAVFDYLSNQVASVTPSWVSD